MTLDISQKVRTDLRDVAGATGSRQRGLEAVEPRGALPARRGVGEPRKAEAVGGGGIASPLTEKTKVVEGKTVPDRDYYAAGLTSSDGLFVLPAVSESRLTDANGDDVIFQFANPQGTVTR